MVHAAQESAPKGHSVCTRVCAGFLFAKRLFTNHDFVEFVEVQYQCMMLMVGVVCCTTYCKTLGPIQRQKLIQQKSIKINIKMSFFIQRAMSILTKCLPVIRVMRGLQTVMWDRQGLLTIIERSIIGGGIILLMGVY